MRIDAGLEDENVDSLVEMIDRLMEQGDGRVNVRTDENSQGIRVDTYSTTDCSGAKGACCQPNEKDEEYDK